MRCKWAGGESRFEGGCRGSRRDNYWDAAISFAEDAATIIGVGAAMRARRCIYSGQRALRFANIASATVEVGSAAIRLGQGFQALGAGNTADALGYFGEATLRLIGLTPQACSYLRRPRCFVAGTPVHTEHGSRPIEEIIAGEQVWAYDRQAQQWQLCRVTQTFRRTSDLLTTVRLADGDEITGTDGHPFWVIEGETLAARPVGDHGEDESSGPTPGRWVAMASLRAGDVVLTKEGRVSRVLAVTTRPEAVPVYNLEVEGLHSYAVGACGVLVHNADAADYTQGAARAARGVPDTPANPQVQTSSTAQPVSNTRPAAQQLGQDVPVSGTTSTTTAASRTPWSNFTDNTARQFRRKPHLPKGGEWKNADGTPGIPGESFWHHSADPNFPPVRYQGQFPVLEPVNGVELRIPLVGRIDPNLDDRNASAALGAMLKNDAALRQRFGISEQFVRDNLLHQNGNVNGTAVSEWLAGQNLVWHHHQDMQWLQLVRNPPHDPDVLRHTGGESYIRGTIEGLIRRGVITEANKRDGLTADLIRRARELGIIPSDFPW